MICDVCKHPIPVQGHFQAGMVCTCYRKQQIVGECPPPHFSRQFSEDEIRRIIREEIRAAHNTRGEQ